MIFIDKKIFNENLKLTQAYCELQLKEWPAKNAAEILRSINPEFYGEKLFSFNPEDRYYSTLWQLNPLFTSSDFYNRLFEYQLDYKNQIIQSTSFSPQYKGKILIAGIDETVTDGASAEVSNGFIDIYDCPPIDTWFYISNNKNGRIFFSWIPEKYSNLVDEGIAVNCVECFYWYDNNSSAIKDWYSDTLSNPWLHNFNKENKKPLNRLKKFLRLKK
ncbi:MAG: hypothetical protein JWQ79_803 [Mucilaginibacter sp.]|nr:hypothetical protein [Mucilaginibacter sp.]